MFELFSQHTYVLAAKAQTRQNGGAGSVLYSLGVLHKCDEDIFICTCTCIFVATGCD